MSKIDVVTMGCRLNTFESEVIRQHAENAGLKDTVIINTCAVTAEAERQARQKIRRLRRDRPSAKIIVTGCAAQIDPASYAEMEEVDQVIGNEEKMRAESYGASRQDSPLVVSDIMTVTETAGHLVSGFEERTRAFVQIQQGCDHRCTFCIIPFGRGNSRSVPIGAIVKQVQELVDRGHQEVVFTGVDISSYGGDLPGAPSLGEMVRRLLSLVPNLPRLRLSSLDPAVHDPALLKALSEEPRLMPHLHLSAQAGNNMILKRMKRRHSREEFLARCEEFRQVRPDVVLGADLIAGFPTETDEMFADTLALIEDAGLTYLHVFPYSERPGTPAADMPSVPKPVRNARAAELRAAGDAAKERYLETLIGKTTRILIEESGQGFTEHYAPTTINGDAVPGTILAATINQVAAGKLVANVS